MNDDLFKNLSLPEGLNKQTLTDNILLRGGEFEVSYPDPTATQSLIGIWSNKMQPTFERWVNALAIDYAPLENYDRHESWLLCIVLLRAAPVRLVGHSGRPTRDVLDFCQ